VVRDSLGAEESAGSVGVQRSPPLCGGHVCGGSAAYDAGEAAECVDGTELLDGVCCGSVHVVRVCDVDLLRYYLCGREGGAETVDG